ncbi:hypothetical protein P875_00053104 [Aspergillus parasiticus SU-1]|uniref:Uncharacterized protein n=1 Tax=Aspergillus parasiticus (strain ATCC 56775 / NRRL 5862 / SRRC 143 / SU-1) TaxID=1403190 RepID=A0A0F0HYW4_ASPPU|nr:hypothetical protein P875_00053104 [Aspergillus parasiticus SU-1]
MQPLSPSNDGGRLRIPVNIDFTYQLFSACTTHTVKCKENTVNELVEPSPKSFERNTSKTPPTHAEYYSLSAVLPGKVERDWKEFGWAADPICEKRPAQAQWDKIYDGSRDDTYIYQRHIEWLKEVVPADRLVFDVKDGWGPLCQTLEKDVPKDIPFPKINDSKAIDRVAEYYMKRGNHYCSRDYGTGSDSNGSGRGDAYHYSNSNGSYYYSNSNGSTYYNDGKGGSTYTPSGGKK